MKLDQLFGPIPKKVIITGQTIYTDGRKGPKDIREFGSRKEALKLLKQSAIPGWAIYDLGKYNVVEIPEGDDNVLLIKISEEENG